MNPDYQINDPLSDDVNIIPSEHNRRFMVYVLVDPSTGEFNIPSFGVIPHTPFYVGKGTSSRKSGHVTESRSNNNLPKNNKLRLLLQVYTMEEIFVPLILHLTNQEAIDFECSLIAELGRRHLGGLLTNITAGGEGRSQPHTNQWKTQHSQRMRGSQNPSAKRSGWLCHPTRGCTFFGPGEFNATIKTLGLTKEARKLLAGYTQSCSQFILSDVEMTSDEVQQFLDQIVSNRIQKFKTKMKTRRENKNGTHEVG